MSIIALDLGTVKFLTTAQVVTSVSTAVKELVENAIDAHANNIEIKLIDNGTSLIEVSDDGTGISICDTEFMGLQSHTSKIKDFSDLDTLESYGFRGEALSSLCKVAEVTVITKTREDEAARSYRMSHDGTIENTEFCHHSIGTTIRVKSLFKDFPVRRQTLMCPKRSNQDVKTLESLLRSFAICQPKIRLTLRVDGKNILMKQSSETLRETLTCIYGNKFVSQFDFVDLKHPEVAIQLTIPKKGSNDFDEICQVGQYIFVNQRPVSYKEMEKVINKRLADHFGNKIPVRKKLFFVLNINVPSADLDVNLEPNKTSVLLVKQAKIVEKLDNLLVKYYEISEITPDVTRPIDADVDMSVEYHDYTSTEIKASTESTEMAPSCKKRKIAVQEGKGSAKSCQKVKNKENRSSNINLVPKKLFGMTESYEEKEETISQLPVVDLGEDFSSQEISNLPNLDPGQIEEILGKRSNENCSSEIETKVQITDEEWSRGRVPLNLHGGTDVQIYNHGIKTETPIDDSYESYSSSTACKGFLKFSKEMRPQILAQNPGIHFVEIAKILTSRWKEISPEERKHYRDMAKSEKNSIETSRESGKSLRQPKITTERAEANRTRFLNMLDSMKNSKISSKKDNAMRRTILPWTISLESVRRNFFHKRSNVSTGNRNIVLGAINDNLWLARTGCQIWALSLEQLLDGLCLKELDFDGRTRESVEELVRRWLNEKEGMSLLQPVFELRA